MTRFSILLACAPLLFGADQFEFKLLGTTKTSTMEKEMNQAAEAGYFFQSVMGGETAFGGNEVVVVMGRDTAETKPTRKYKLLAASKTSTLQKEMQSAADEGFVYKGQTVFESAFGGREVSVIMERNSANASVLHEYRLLATSKTATMQKELNESGRGGFTVVGMTVGKTSFGGDEVICIMSKEKN